MADVELKQVPEKCDCLWCEGAGGHDEDPRKFAYPEPPDINDYGFVVRDVPTPVWGTTQPQFTGYQTFNTGDGWDFKYHNVPIQIDNNAQANMVYVLNDKIVNATTNLRDQLVEQMFQPSPMWEYFKEAKVGDVVKVPAGTHVNPNYTLPEINREAAKKKEEYKDGLRKFRFNWWRKS